ncbi:1,4-beta-D-xylan synthase [Trifolium repens]|nr:1,4-beta-D-xylan synthase [Trifolium repens]
MNTAMLASSNVEPEYGLEADGENLIDTTDVSAFGLSGCIFFGKLKLVTYLLAGTFLKGTSLRVNTTKDRLLSLRWF